MRAAVAALVAGGLVASEPASAVPTPPPRPPATAPQAPTFRADPVPPAAVESSPPSAPRPAAAAMSCVSRLVTAGHKAEPIPQPSTDPSCAIEEPVRLLAVADPFEAGRSIALPGAPVVACGFAERLAGFLGDVAAPVVAARFGQRLAAVQTGPGFQCRPRNHQAGAKPSAHGRGLAIDVAAYTLADGRSIHVKPDRDPGDPGVTALRISACGWFTTVLGPGADAFHTDHMHLDIERHGSSDRYRICE